MQDNTLLERLKVRLSYDKNTYGSVGQYEKTLNQLLEDSKYIALSLYAPYEDEEIELPKRYNNWLIRCAVELYNGIGTVGLKSYAENGISWTRDSDYLSKGLKEEIEPMIGVIRGSKDV